MYMKKIFSAIMILCVLFSVPVYAHEADMETEISNNSTDTVIEYNIATGEQKKITYEIDSSLTSTADFLAPISPQDIIGTDDREPLDTAIVPPFSCIGYMRMKKMENGIVVQDSLLLIHWF